MILRFGQKQVATLPVHRVPGIRKFETKGTRLMTAYMREVTKDRERRRYSCTKQPRANSLVKHDVAYRRRDREQRRTSRIKRQGRLENDVFELTCIIESDPRKRRYGEYRAYWKYIFLCGFADIVGIRIGIINESENSMSVSKKSTVFKISFVRLTVEIVHSKSN